jgi:hypothetical protein
MIPIELIGLRSRSAYQLNGADPASFGRGFASLDRLARKIACAISAPNKRRLISQPFRCIERQFNGKKKEKDSFLD